MMSSQYFSGQKILIVGGAGFIGSNLAKMILRDNERVNILIVDNLLSSEQENIPNDFRVTFVRGSICRDSILQVIDDTIDIIFHLATYHGNQSSIFDPLKDHYNNALTTLKLLDHVKNFRYLKKFIYSSAGCSVAEKTFDDPEATKEKESVSIYQDSPYSISKIMGEFYCRYYFKQHSVPTVRVRFQNVYGPGEILGAGEWRGTPATVWRNVVPTFIYRALKGMPLNLEGGGSTSRDFVYVEDICKGLVLCAKKGVSGEVYNLGSGREVFIKDLAQMILELTGSSSELRSVPRREWDHSGRRFADINKARTELGYSPEIEIKDGIKRTIDWTIKNLKLIEACIYKHADKMEII
ncbi:MAG: NAD-dependent epimerase/dehydratase family protein [Nitrososphaeria archaeon]